MHFVSFLNRSINDVLLGKLHPLKRLSTAFIMLHCVLILEGVDETRKSPYQIVVI